MEDNLGISDLQVLENTMAAADTASAAADAGDAHVDVDVNATIDQAIKEETAGDPKPAAPADASAPVKDATAAADAAKDGDTHTQDADASKKGTEPEPLDIDLGENLTIKSLNTKLATSPEFKAFLDKDPEFKRQLFYAGRRAERADQYDELFQTPVMAKAMKEHADDHFELSNLYQGDEASPENFLQKLFTMSLVKDAKGEPVRDASGRYQTTGAYDQAMYTSRSAFYGQLDEAAKSLGDRTINGVNAADLQEALAIIKTVENAYGFKHDVPARSDAAPAEASTNTTLPDDVKAKLDRLAQLENSNGERDKQTFETFNESATKAATDALQASVMGSLNARVPANSTMTDYTKKSMVRDVVSEVERLSKANRAHADMRSRLVKSTTRDEAGTKQLVDFELAYAKEIYPRILARLLSENTTKAVTDNAATRLKAQNQQKHKEVETSGGAVPPSRQDVKTKADELLKAAKDKGKRMTDMELVNALSD